MADPLSVAASVAGLVSLGLSAFQGLMAYCGPYKTFYQDINNLVVRVHLLSQNLRLLQYQFANPSGLNSAFATQYADNVRDNIAACGGGLKELEAILANCREETDPSKKTWEDKFHVKRLKYPFNQDQLKSIYGTVGAMEGLLSLALHTQGM
ncbi:hypothetical protein BO78DRAFT_327474 [Aspergillus sclerotiicarbonarius CBS 121057]|uniref:Fungal N-terminal domain-containing protein n=1 Tax=Aspergillus sclerotiicarbonarius (strain CBS 121057 / IBT 28362) TaxID=1448318 RepID=A0A319DUT5_ASPSB|nr:hypothetical protein BO78DRAFT_327474 [Aspergillus sclerotiicarbonarius CBS 121057]